MNDKIWIDVGQEIKKLKGLYVKAVPSGKGIEYQITKPGEEIMEDRISFGELKDLTLTEEELGILRPRFEEFNGFVEVEIWNKVGLTVDDILLIRSVVDKLAKEHKLLKVFLWGMDDGGALTVDLNNEKIVKSYINRFGEVELEEFGPDTEEEFWSITTGITWEF